MLVLCHPQTILSSNAHYLIPICSSKGLMSVGDSSMIKAISLQCDLSYSSFVLKLMHKEVENCLPSFLRSWLLLFFFFGWYFLRNNSSLTSLTELNFGFSYRVQVNFSMTLNCFSCISSENPMSPNRVRAVLSLSGAFNGRFFPFLKNATL